MCTLSTEGRDCLGKMIAIYRIRSKMNGAVMNQTEEYLLDASDQHMRPPPPCNIICMC